MVQPPNPEEEDRRRLTRERSTLIKERVQVDSGTKRNGLSKADLDVSAKLPE